MKARTRAHTCDSRLGCVVPSEARLIPPARTGTTARDVGNRPIRGDTQTRTNAHTDITHHLRHHIDATLSFFRARAACCTCIPRSLADAGFQCKLPAAQALQSARKPSRKRHANVPTHDVDAERMLRCVDCVSRLISKEFQLVSAHSLLQA